MKLPILAILFFFVLSPVYVFAALDEGDAYIITDGVVLETPISVETNLSSYEKGSTIEISGLISNYDESDPTKVYDITLKIIAPNNNLITIDQIKPNSGGTYSTSVNTEGANWKVDGDYTVAVNYADKSASTTFTFVIPEVEATEAEVEATEAEAAEKCGEGTHLEDGVCILDESSSVESTPGESTPDEAEPASTDFNSWIYSITFTLLIAFVIAIFLYLISRVRGKKTV
ncbi:MAG: hypothetical protein NZ811_02970 [Gammaproteobacteria bacterium]|nr:hypothetical protein [Gammaproteobacteria bacterium]